MKIHTCEQLSDEWWELHRGRPTASRMGDILTPKTMKLSSSWRGLALNLIAELAYQGPITDLGRKFTNRAIQQGIDTEAEARRWYALERGVVVQGCGFMTTDDGRFGCSPDGLIVDSRLGMILAGIDGGPVIKGGLELKAPQPDTHLRWLDEGGLPGEHRAQVHGCLIVSEFAWWDFVSYPVGCPDLPPILIRVEPDAYTVALKDALETFWREFEALKDKLLRKGG